MAIKTQIEISEEEKQNQLQDFRNKLQALEIESIDSFSESITSILPDDSIIDPELVTCRLFRVSKMNSNQDQKFIEDLDVNSTITESDLGIKFGGGIYKIITTIRIRNPNNPDVTQKLTHKNTYFQLDDIWNLRKSENDEINQMTHINRVRDFEKKALGGEQSNNTNDLLMQFMTQQLQASQQQNQALILAIANKPSQQMDLQGMAAMMQQLKPQNDTFLDMFKPLLMDVLKPKAAVSEQKNFLTQLKEFKSIMNELPGSQTENEDNDSITDKFLKEFLPALPDIANQLLSKKAGYFPNAVQEKLTPYEKEIALINSNPEIKEATLNSLKENGFNESQIDTVQKRAKIDLTPQKKPELKESYAIG